MSAALPAWFRPGDERAARAVWSRITEPVDRPAARLVAEHGAAEALRFLLGGGGRTSPNASRWLVRLEGARPDRDTELLHRFGGRVVVPGDAEWPGSLDALGDGAPLCLWVRGPLQLADATARAIAVVGSRDSTDYGQGVTTEIAHACAERGLTVVSGAAYGIDAAAHRAALAGSGATVAVLACGVDRAYPRGNVDLIDRIAAEGLVVSEVPPGSSPTRNRFVHRNRLIAGLAAATVVVEAGWRSGASITASYAGDLGRPVGAVPGPVTSPASAGCHRLLREGSTCVTGPADVFELVDPLDAAARAEPGALLRSLQDDLPEDDLRVLDALPVRTAATVASLASVAGLDSPALLAGLGRLELLGLVARAGSGWRRVAPIR